MSPSQQAKQLIIFLKKPFRKLLKNLHPSETETTVSEH